MKAVVYGFLMSVETPEAGRCRQPISKILLAAPEVAACMAAVERFWDDEKDSLLVIEVRGENRRVVCGAENVEFRGREWNVHRAPKGFVWDRGRELPVVDE